MGAACVVWGCGVLCGSALGKALPSRSHHAQHTAFMASRKTTWCLFPRAFQGYTQQSSGMYKRMTETASHSSQTTLIQSIPAVFLCWNSEVSTANIKVHPPGTVRKEFNQRCTWSISGEEIQKCSFLLTCPNIAVLFHTRNPVPAVQAQCLSQDTCHREEQLIAPQITSNTSCLAWNTSPEGFSLGYAIHCRVDDACNISLVMLRH